MRMLSLLLGLLFFAPPPDAEAATVPRSIAVLGGAVAGGAGGALLGAPIYGVLDPYDRDDGLEWLLIGAPAGFGVGAALGGALTHGLVGGPRVPRVLLASAIPGLAGAGLLLATPALYQDFDDDRFAASWVGGLVLAVVVAPFAASITSGLVRRPPEPVTVLPVVGPEHAGLALVGRF